MALVSYRPFIDFAFSPSISFLLVAASYCLLKKSAKTYKYSKGQVQVAEPLHFLPKKNPFFGFLLILILFLPYVYSARIPFTQYSVRCVYKAARRGKKETDYLKATVRAFVITVRTPWFLLEEWSFNARGRLGRPGVCI